MSLRQITQWESLTRPAPGDLRRPIWLFRAFKPVLDAYQLPHDPRLEQARQAAATLPPSAFDLADHVDWSPEETLGPLSEVAPDKAVTSAGP